tara:strand:- start:312 stop:515 length:204 start_codon:yes stop_codon:yes gene_type:complete
MKESALDHIKELGLYHVQSVNEIDVIVPDVEYVVENGYYQDPDEQLCEHYGINYDLVNMIELDEVPA